MNNVFHPFPILITQNNLPYDLLEYDLIPLKEFDELQIKRTQTEETLCVVKKSDLKKLTLPCEWNQVEFIYYFEGKIVLNQFIDLNQTRTYNPFHEEVVDDYERLLDLIRHEMDNPKGTGAEIAHQTQMLNQCLVSEAARQFILAKIKNVLIRTQKIKPQDVERLAYETFAELYGLGPIQSLDDDPEIGEIMVNAIEFPEFKCDIYYIKGHQKYRHTENFKNISEVERVFNNCIAFENKQLNAVDNAIVEANRPNKDRVNILIPDATEGWTLNIRKFSCFVPNKESMKAVGTIDDFIDELFEVLVKGKANIGIGGPMGTGKTTMINYMLTYTPPSERKMVIASVSETDVERVLKGHDIIIGKVDEEKGFTFAKLLKASLRTTSDRVIIPESRGEEFKELYEANLKTKGNMFTAHAIDAKGFMEACVDMYLSNPNVSGETAENIRNKLVNGIDIIIMMRLVGNKIRIKSISEVTSDEDGHFDKIVPLYEFVFDPENPLDGHYQRTDYRLSNKLKTRLNEMGIPFSTLDQF